MRAVDKGWWQRAQLLRRSVLVVAAVTSAAPAHQTVAETTAQATCTIPTEATAHELSEQWNAALKTRHPDRVTRLFASDGALLGFASPIVRGNYMTIRDYYLYFLQFEPQVRIGDRHLELGCNFVIESGTYTWTLKSKATDTVEKREARYRFIYELVNGQWRITQHVDELVSAISDTGFAVPPPMSPRVAQVDKATGAAVAGFIKRSEPPQVAPVPVVAPAVKAKSTTGSKLGRTTPSEGAAAKPEVWLPEYSSP